MLTFLIGILIHGVPVLVKSETEYADGYPKEIIFSLVIAFIVIIMVIPNVLFVLLLHFTGVFKKALSSIPYLVGEICILYLVYYLFDKMVNSFPSDVRWKYFDLLPFTIYLFIIMFIIALITRWVVNKQVANRQ